MAKAARPPARYSGGDRERIVAVPASPDRTDFRRDYSRLLHSPSFRRLAAKVQLFPGHENDFFRNRLTHSLEVAQIGKSIAGILNANIFTNPRRSIDLDLVELACLAHDIGHPPFGHVGEFALDRCMRELGGFEGNAQSLRIVTCIEKKELRPSTRVNKWRPVDDKGVDRRVGLNLTYRAMASLLKYDRPIPAVRDSGEGLAKGYYYFDAPLINAIREKVLGSQASQDVKLRTIECSIMDTADDIAYSTFDLEDAFKSGM